MTTLYEPTEWVSGTTPLSAGALNKLEQGIRRSTPIGAIFALLQDDPPFGFLKLDGSTVSRTTFQDLFDYVVAHDLINNGPFGDGDGETTFVLPDMRQRFLRMAPSGSGGQTGGQDAHQHANPNTSNQPNHAHSNPNTDNAGSHTHGIGSGNSMPGGLLFSNFTQPGGTHSHPIGNTGPGGSHAHTQGPTSAVSHHPPYMTVNYFIAT